MKIIRDWYFDEGRVDKNAVTLQVYFSDAEFEKVLQYDSKRLGDNEKIIGYKERYIEDNIAVIDPIKLKDAVDSGLITKLEIIVKDNPYYRFKSPALQLMKNCGFKSLCITTLQSFTLQPSHAEDIIKLINGYKGTLDQLEFHFKKVDMTAFSKIYEVVENCIINTPLNVSLTATKDTSNKLCESLPEYNDIQAKIKLVPSCPRYSKPFAALEKTIDERTQEYEKIVKNDPEFIKDFGKYAASKVTKTAMGDNMYNTFLRCYTDNSTIVKFLSECCYNYTKQRKDGRCKKYLPYDAKELIVKHIGGIAAITKIDNDLENNNSTTDQQDDVINQAEAMNDVHLTTSGTTSDSDCGDGLFKS